MTINAPEGYEQLARVLQEALDQAAAGKGKERHANEGEAFEDQQIVQLGEWLGTNHFQLGQACKKLLEAARLPPDRARREILGAINYAAAAVIQMDRAQPVRTDGWTNVLTGFASTVDYCAGFSFSEPSKQCSLSDKHEGPCNLNRLAPSAYRSGVITGASGEVLDKIGAMYNLPRKVAETDETYRGRIQSALPSVLPSANARAAERVIVSEAEAMAPGAKWTGVSEDGQAVLETEFQPAKCAHDCVRAKGHHGPCVPPASRRK